ncbi:MAG: ATP-binding protein [bacterium]|nr:ATP-binding protein [bacterium]
MRKFCSYGPVNTKLHYYAPREALLENALTQLIGENPQEGGHDITVWAPRQTGKTWVMHQVLFRLQEDDCFDVVKLQLEHLGNEEDVNIVAADIGRSVLDALGKPQQTITTLSDFQEIFTKMVLSKPLILMLDEFDILAPPVLSQLVRIFRNMYIQRQQDVRISGEKDFLLHGVALIGVRSVLGVDNLRGSPFNVQRSLHIPNLTFPEVEKMFEWYERESGQQVEQNVVKQLYAETRGQPGLTCWLGELLTEGFEEYQPPGQGPITMEQFEEVYAAAVKILPNSNITNILSKARQEPYKDLVLELLKTDEKREFTYDDPHLNYLYMHGAIDREPESRTTYSVRFASPFVQKRLFNAFSHEMFEYIGKIYPPFENLSDTITEDDLYVRNILKRYEGHLKANREWLLRDAPRRKTDLRIYEAVYHFHLYMYLYKFLQSYKGRVYPEFPAGNGKIDLILKYAGKMYGLEVKSFTHDRDYRESLIQAARYGKELQLKEITLAFFVESIDDENRQKYEISHSDKGTGVTVNPVFVQIGV